MVSFHRGFIEREIVDQISLDSVPGHRWLEKRPSRGRH